MNPTIALHQLSRGSEVVSLQLMLRELDYALEPDGFFGPMTREAVISFQATHGLPADGMVDPATWDALETCYADLQRAMQNETNENAPNHDDSERFVSVRETGLEPA